LADIHEGFDDVTITNIDIHCDQDIPTPSLALPLSGRDIQALSREIGSHIPIMVYPCYGARGLSFTMETLMPGGYASSGRRYVSAPSTYWKDTNAPTLDALLGIEGGCMRLETEALITLEKAKKQYPSPRVMAALSTNNDTITAYNLPVMPQGVPSCAEHIGLTLALSKFPTFKLKALFQIITDDGGMPVLGNHAAPCGFCRETILQCSDENSLVILSNGEGAYQYAHASTLLPQSRHGLGWSSMGPLVHDNDYFKKHVPYNKDTISTLHRLSVQGMAWQRTDTLFVAYHKATGTAYCVTAMESAYADCSWPPMLVQLLLLENVQADIILITSHTLEKRTLSAYIRTQLPLVCKKDTPILFANQYGILHGRMLGDLDMSKCV
jgi:cytidine deaminase